MKFNTGIWNQLTEKERSQILEIAHYSLINDRHVLEDELQLSKNDWTRLFTMVTSSLKTRSAVFTWEELLERGRANQTEEIEDTEQS